MTKKINWLLLFAIFVLVAGQATAQSSQKEQKEDDEKEAAARLVEYGDYQCPACGYYHKMVKKLKSELGDRVDFKFYHFPLQQHQYAALAARAAEAARNQGKFREMHDKLYSNQKEWSKGNATQLITNYAKSIDLDMKQFKMDLNARETQEKVMQDKKKGIGAGVNSTPTFFVNGQKLETPRSYEVFKQKVTEAIESGSKE